MDAQREINPPARCSVDRVLGDKTGGSRTLHRILDRSTRMSRSREIFSPFKGDLSAAVYRHRWPSAPPPTGSAMTYMDLGIHILAAYVDFSAKTLAQGWLGLTLGVAAHEFHLAAYS